MGTLNVHVVLHIDALTFLRLTEVLKILVEEHSYLLPLKKSCALVSDLQSEVCCALCQIYV